MHRGAPALLSVLAGVLLVQGTARAQDIEPRAVFISSLGYNDNVTNTPSYPRVGASTRAGDGFWSLGPSASVSYETPWTNQRLAYALDARFNFTRPNANTYGNKIAYLGTFHLDATTSLNLTLSGKEGRLGTLVPSDPSAEASLESLPQGLFTYVDLGADEKLTKELTALTRIYQKVSFSERLPLESAEEFSDPEVSRLLVGRARARLNADVGVGAEHDLPFDTLGVDVDLGYLFTADDGRYINSVSASWTHDCSKLGLPGLTTRLDAGLVEMMRAKDLGGQLVQPTAAAAASFDLDDRQASISFVHSPKANLVNGTLNYVDSLTLRAATPLWRNSEFKASGSGGWQRNLQIGAYGDVGDPQNVFLMDGQLSYAPKNRTFNALTFSLRFQRRVQLQMPPARDGFYSFDGMDNDTYVFAVSVSYPARDTYRAPFLIPRYRPEPTGETDVEGSAESVTAPPDSAPAP